MNRLRQPPFYRQNRLNHRKGRFPLSAVFRRSKEKVNFLL